MSEILESEPTNKKELEHIHQHTTDGEIYFGGANGTVLLLDDKEQEIGKFDLGDDTFTATTIGEWHSVTTGQNNEGAIFFGVKFETEKK